jgi:hypothetical protein
MPIIKKQQRILPFFLAFACCIFTSPKLIAGPYYWRAFEVFPQGYKDGGRWLREWTHSLTNLKLNDDVERTRFQLLQGAMEMEMEQLYMRLPISLSNQNTRRDGERAIAVMARRENEGTIVALHSEIKPPAWKNIGDFNILGRLQKKTQAGREEYFLDASFSAFNGKHTAADWKKVFDQWILDFYADEFGQGLPLHWQLSHPKLSQEINQYLALQSSVEKKRDGRIIVIDAKVKMKDLQKMYPHAFRYLRRLQGVFQLELVIPNLPFGNHVITYNSKERHLKMQLALGRQQVESGVWPQKVLANANMTVQLHGVNVFIQDWPIEILHNHKDFTFEWQSAGPPKKLEMKGNTVMSIPLMLVQNFLALDQQLEEFFVVLSSPTERMGRPNLGLGIGQEENQTHFSANLVVPFRQSMIIRMGMGMIGNKLNPPPALLTELEKWRARLFDLLIMDFEESCKIKAI